jgi:hypothetical protein
MFVQACVRVCVRGCTHVYKCMCCCADINQLKVEEGVGTCVYVITKHS